MALAISLAGFFAVLLFDPAVPVPDPDVGLLASETVIGLAIGYITKYQLDRRFVFAPGARAEAAE